MEYSMGEILACGGGRFQTVIEIRDRSAGTTRYQKITGTGPEEVRKRAEAFIQREEGARGIPLRENGTGEDALAREGTSVFGDVFACWLEETRRKRKASTCDKYERIYRKYLAPSLSDLDLSEGDEAPFRRVLSETAKTDLSVSLFTSIIVVLNLVLKYSSRERGVPLLHFAKEDYIGRRTRRPVEIFSRSELSVLIPRLYESSCKGAPALLFCFGTGLRLGELCALRWEDIDFASRTIRVQRTVERVVDHHLAPDGALRRTSLVETVPKTETSIREIPLPDDLAELLERHRNGGTYVFGNNAPLDPRTMEAWYSACLEEAGVAHHRFHTVRHTFATNSIEANMDVKSLSEILGHADVSITLNRYVHPTFTSKRQHMNAVSDLMEQYRRGKIETACKNNRIE